MWSLAHGLEQVVEFGARNNALTSVPCRAFENSALSPEGERPIRVLGQVAVDIEGPADDTVAGLVSLINVFLT